MGALASSVGGDAVNSHRSEDQREHPEPTDKCSGDALTEAGDLLARFERDRKDTEPVVIVSQSVPAIPGCGNP
jgi:hypothetical protein